LLSRMRLTKKDKILAPTSKGLWNWLIILSEGFIKDFILC
jgi:hypothetical protein